MLCLRLETQGGVPPFLVRGQTHLPHHPLGPTGSPGREETLSSTAATLIQIAKLVKNAVLKAFELVRKRFQTCRKGEKQTHLEFTGDLTKHFDRWCSALEINDYDSLSEYCVWTVE